MSTRLWSTSGSLERCPAMRHSHAVNIPTWLMSNYQCDISEQGPGKSGRAGRSLVPLPDACLRLSWSPHAPQWAVSSRRLRTGSRKPLQPWGQRPQSCPCHALGATQASGLARRAKPAPPPPPGAPSHAELFSSPPTHSPACLSEVGRAK